MATLNVIYRIAADIAGLDANVNKAVQKFDSVESAARKVGAAIGAAFSVQQIAAAAEKAGQTASRIQDLSSQAGISAEAMQRLDHVAKQTGTTFDAVSNAIVTMSQNLVSGDKGAVAALDQLGLSVDQLRSMAPDEAFRKIAEELAKIPDPMQQNTLALEIFGGRAKELLPMIKSDIDSIAAAAPVMSEAMVQAGDDFDDKMVEMQTRLDNLKAQSLLPLMETFLAMPQSVQVGVLALMELTPILSSLGILLMSLGGPTGVIGMVTAAWGAMATFITGTILPLITTALPYALRALAALFSVPAGLVIAGILAVVAIWRNWDTIGPIVANVYNAVKTWLVDKFQAIVQSIKAKIDAVTGFFGDMYDKVVGHSYVPDMIAGIEAEFGKLPNIMVNPTQVATNAVTGLFEGLVQRIAGLLGGPGSVLGKILTGGLGALFGPGGPLISLAMQGIQALSGLIMGGLSAIGSAVGDFFKNLFGGGVIGTVVNPARDAWFKTYGDGSMEAVAAELAKYGIDGNQARDMIAAVFNAKSMEDLKRATDAIDRAAGRGGSGITSPDDLARRGYAMRGGLVTEQGVQRLAQGGRVLRFVPKGTDTVPAMLTPGEGVVNTAGMGVLGQDGLANLNSGRSAGGHTLVQNITINAGVYAETGDLAKKIAELNDKGLEQGGRPLERFDRRVVQAVKCRRVA